MNKIEICKYTFQKNFQLHSIIRVTEYIDIAKKDNIC